MTVECTLTKTGIDPEKSIKAFMNSYIQSSQVSRYNKYEHQLNEFFVDKIRNNIESSGINVSGLSDSFQLNIENNRIEFSTTMSDVANTFEYGSDNVSPRRFIEPAVIQVANNMSQKIIHEAMDIYQANTRTASISKKYHSR